MAKTEENSTKQPPNSHTVSSCGIGLCQPQILQRFRNVLSFTLFNGLSALVMQTLNSYIASQVTALEKQFNLTSSTTGLISSCNDIGLMCTIIFVSHFGNKHHIPRILSAAVFLVGFSGILASMTYFISPFSLPKLSDGTIKNLTGQNEFVAPLCGKGNVSHMGDCKDSRDSSTATEGPSWPVGLICICMVLQGSGMAPRVPLSTAYIDDNNKDKTKSGFFMGINATMSILGFGVALILGGVFRSIPVDLQDTDLTPTHPKWIGAWWMGFLVFGFLSLIFGIPLLLFPKHILPVQEKQLDNKSSQALENIKGISIAKLDLQCFLKQRRLNKSIFQKEVSVEQIPVNLEGQNQDDTDVSEKDLPRSILRVFKKKIYTLTLCGLLFQSFVVGGIQAFRSKYVEKQFMVPAYKTNIILGVSSIISITIGTFGGGVVTSRLKLSRLGNLRLVLLATFLQLLTAALGFFLGCETPHVHGFHDDAGTSKLDNGVSVCSCDTSNYFPVCGEEIKTYFSPCFAGCTNQSLSTYGGCSEISDGKTTAGICETDCPYLYYYMAVDALQLLSGTFSVIPFSMTLIRTVEPKDKALAVGVFQFSTNLIGMLPGPIVFGYVIDSACLIWGYQCGTKGACSQYELANLRFRLKALECGGVGVGFVFIVLAYITLKMQGTDEANGEETEVKCVKAKKTETTRL